MKKNLYIILILIILSTYLYSAEPLVKFYLNDGSSKQYNLSNIDSINILEKKNNYVMRIHYQDTLVAYYPTEIIGSIKFEKDSATRDILNVYIFSYPKSYILSSIDSVIFYIDQYQPLTIGSQVWMLKNLNVDHYRNGAPIPEVKNQYEWIHETGAWCNYNNDTSIGLIYGKLYNWYALSDFRGLAPNGWHVPSDIEWDVLIEYLGGVYIAGGKLKETGTNHWQSPNEGATNESGFSALSGGGRQGNGTFNSIGNYGCWWSSPEFNSAGGWYRFLFNNVGSIYKNNYGRLDGRSVRCIKDN